MNNVTTFDNFPPFATNGSRNMNTESAKYQVGFLEGETFPAEWANYLFHGATKGVSDLNTAVQSIWKENINVIQGSGQTPSPSDNTQLKTAIELMIQNAVLTANSQVLAQAKLEIQNAVSTANSQVLAQAKLEIQNAVSTANSQVLAQAKLEIQNAVSTANAQVLAQAKLEIQNAISTANAQVLAQAKLDAHPVGSLYWSSDPTDPSILFGGTWVQIKDRFIWAKGDSDTVNAMGGSKTVGLTVNNLPSHSHYYTPNGSVGSHSHGLNNHTHSFSGTTGNVSNSGDTWNHSHISGVLVHSGQANTAPWGSSGPYRGYRSGQENPGNYNSPNTNSVNLQHTHSFSGTTGGSNANTSDTQPSFTGTRAQTESTGWGSAVTVMNPYVVKYCWERVS